MKKKLASILVCTLVIVAMVLPITGTVYGSSFLGVDEYDLYENYTGTVRPPDPIIAAGPEHLVVMTNGAICFFQKNGTKDDQMDIRGSEGFWGEVGVMGSTLCDPWVIYDPHSNRFMAVALERYSAYSYFLLAVSDDNNPNPNSSWYKWRINVTNLIDRNLDFVKIGVDPQAVYLCGSNNTLNKQELIYILEKDPLLEGNIGINNSKLFNDTSNWGIPIIYGDAPAMYMIQHFTGGSNYIRLHAITDPLGEPDYVSFNLTVPYYSNCTGAPQNGSSRPLDTNGVDILSCVWRNGSLWAAHHQGSPVRARWYEIKTNSWPTSDDDPVLHQSGNISPGGEICTFYPAIAPDGYGNAAICFVRSSPDEYPSIRGCYRLSDDQLGTMRDIEIIKQSNTCYDPVLGGTRWGDYYGISCDIADNRTFWMHGEYTDDGEYWKTWVYSIKPTYNTCPNAPTIDGPPNGKAGEEYNYTFTSTDPDDDNVRYYINWGDGKNNWTTFHPSGEEVTVGHTWAKKGTYTIEAFTQDIYGCNSSFSTLEVTMPKNIFGYTISGTFSQNINNKISGSKFTMLANGTADNITVYIQTNLTSPKTQCMIYRVSDSVLFGATEEKILNTGNEGAWVTFNFSYPKPTLIRDIEYVLVSWSNDTCNFFYDNATSEESRYRNETYSTGPVSPIEWTSNESKIYSIFCRYTTKPEITNVSATPNTVGFGFNVTISADINDNGCDIDNVFVNITYPNNNTGNFTMDITGNSTYAYVFNDTWVVGQYNYTVWAVDESGGTNNSSVQNFNVSANATISVCTIKDEYGDNETINLTDPPGDPSLIGYELMDDGKILRIWNNYDSYYFNTTSGIQLTNHYNDYWSHNVLMLGYYNNDQWNLIYRTDELSGFNKNIESDNETFVNATLWKDLSYQGYDFRLAIRYYLGVDDTELTVILYIKNLGQNFPYNLGFAWELKDIQVDMTTSGDYIEINGTTYLLNQSLDETYTNMSLSCFYIREDITGDRSESLYLCWNDSLDYLVKVKSREGQYNAPVTLGIKIGILGVGQEKYTSLLWHDASEVTYYFNSYSISETWAAFPSWMVDGSTSTYASTSVNGDVELCNGNNCSGSNLGNIIKVELRAYGYYTGTQRDIILTPVFDGITDGGHYTYITTSTPSWSTWFDITTDPFFTPPWSWTKVKNLDCDVEAESSVGFFTLYCSKVEIRVTYISNSNPVISNPYPADGSTGISIAPVLNITVSDPDGDNMNITWLSNSSGSWQVFGTNTSVGNGTYHQTMVNASVNGEWWYWKVNVTDGTNYIESNVYKFYTGSESKIKNTGSTNISGYLLMQVHFNDSGTWVVADDVVNESTMRVIGIGEQLSLDTIFNPCLVYTSDLLCVNGSGDYRVYAALCDSDGDVLVCNDDGLMEATYEFSVNL